MRRPRDDGDNPDLPLTSLIDVVFLLLIFFLVATNFIRREVDQQVQLPRAGGPAAGTAEAPPELVVNVRADGALVVNGRVTSRDGLRDEIRAWRAARGDGGGRAAIRGDGRVPYETVMQVMGLCRREGVLEVDLPVLEDNEGLSP